MALTNPQKALLKRAQREAGIEDAEYRETLQLICGVRSSTALSLTDRDLDRLLAYLEAIAWRGFDAGTLQPSRSAAAVFRKPGYWKAKNTNRETSRDRFTGENIGSQIAALEGELQALGFGPGYCATIRAKVCGQRNDGHAMRQYQAALARTLNAKARQAEAARNPF